MVFEFCDKTSNKLLIPSEEANFFPLTINIFHVLSFDKISGCS